MWTGPHWTAVLARNERGVVDEAGANLALVGDRAQLPAVGRGGVLGLAVQTRRVVHQLDEVHRFADPA